MDIIDAILTFKEDSNKLISDFSVFDKNDPISPVKLSFLKDAINFWIDILGDTVKQYNNYLNILSKKNTNALQNYNNNISNLNTSLATNIQRITNEHIEACNKLKIKIEEQRNKTTDSIEQLELDYNYFLITSDQNKKILQMDFEETKKRYDYQKDEAKNSYHEVVKKNNKLLENIKYDLSKKYQEDVQNYSEENIGIINKLKQIIDNKENELKALLKALEKEKNEMKEKYRQESTNLNDNIKKIVDEKNIIIDKAKNEYSKSLNEITIEKENNKQILQSKSQALLKEFVTKINEIDENTAFIKKEFEENVDKIKREYYYNVFKKTKNLHKQLEQIYGSSNASTLDKYTNNLIKFKNKEHIKSIQLYKREVENKLYELTKNHTLKVLENRNTKNFLEIDKNFAIGNITTQEQYDNKYYQEKSSIYENDHSYSVTVANCHFSQKANILRSQSQIRTKLLERNFDSIQANYYKKIETIQTKINSLTLEIRLTEQLSQIIKGYQENSFFNSLHLEEVTNLLEIEKNKLLFEYNKNQYDYIIKKLNLSKEYGFKKIDLENQKNKIYKDLKIKLENTILEKSTASTGFDIKHEELSEKYSKIKIQLINNNDLKVTKDKYLSILKNNDIKYLDYVTNSFCSFFDSFKRNLQNVITIIMKDIFPTKENYRYIEKFINSFLSIFINLAENFTTAVKDIIVKAIDNRTTYIYKFKYKSSIDSIKETYSNEIKNIKEKRTIILDKIDSANKTIENFRQKIYTLINDNEMIFNNNKINNRRNISKSSAIKENELKIKEYREKIETFFKMIKMSNDDLQSLNYEKAIATKKYKIDSKLINKIRREDTKIYDNYKSITLNYYNSFLRDLDEINVLINKISTNKKNIFKSLQVKQNSIFIFIDKNKVKIRKNYSLFSKLVKKEINKNQNLSILEFKKEIQKFESQKEKSELEFQKEFKLNIEAHSKRLHDHNVYTIKTLNYYNQLLENAKTLFERDSDNIKNINDKLIDKFYTLYYALEDNNDNIIAHHKKVRVDNDNNYKKDKNASVKRNTQLKDEMNNKLEQFIKTKNQEVEQLPVAFKFNSRVINNETKKKNLSISYEIRKHKIEHTNQKKKIEKQLNIIKNQLSQQKISNEVKQKQNIINEKKNHKNNIKNAIKNIKISI